MSSLDAAIYNEARKAASGAPLWSSGMTVAQWQEVRSPLDGEVYLRKTATGSGATDPADDTTNYIAVSFGRVSAVPIVTLASSTSLVTYVFNGVTKVLTGTINIGVRTSILSITGRGRADFLGFFKGAPGGGTLELFIDGRQVTAGSISALASNAALLIGSAAGHYDGTSYVNLYNALPMGGVSFRRSLQVFFTPTSSAVGANAALMYSVTGES